MFSDDDKKAPARPPYEDPDQEARAKFLDATTMAKIIDPRMDGIGKKRDYTAKVGRSLYHSLVNVFEETGVSCPLKSSRDLPDFFNGLSESETMVQYADGVGLLVQKVVIADRRTGEKSTYVLLATQEEYLVDVKGSAQKGSEFVRSCFLLHQGSNGVWDPQDHFYARAGYAPPPTSEEDEPEAEMTKRELEYLSIFCQATMELEKSLFQEKKAASILADAQAYEKKAKSILEGKPLKEKHSCTVDDALVHRTSAAVYVCLPVEIQLPDIEGVDLPEKCEVVLYQPGGTGDPEVLAVIFDEEIDRFHEGLKAGKPFDCSVPLPDTAGKSRLRKAATFSQEWDEQPLAITQAKALAQERPFERHRILAKGRQDSLREYNKRWDSVPEQERKGRKVSFRRPSKGKD